MWMNWPSLVLRAFFPSQTPIQRPKPKPHQPPVISPRPSVTPIPVEPDMNLMHVVVDRTFTNQNVTLSDVYIDGVKVCHGLEDTYRTVKVWGETRIPAGVYEMVLRRFGGFHERYSKAAWIKDVHKGMLWVKNVPNFEGILWHVGNTKKDTHGCLLLGMSRSEKAEQVSLSRMAYKKVYPIISNHLAKGGEVRVEYRNSDGTV